MASKWEKESPEPPPINLLGLPFAAWRQLSRRCAVVTIGKRQIVAPRYTKYVADDLKIEAHAGWAARFGEKAALVAHVDAYVVGHLDDVLPEERWRADLSKKLSRVLREQQSLGERLAGGEREAGKEKTVSRKVGRPTNKLLEA